MAAHLRALADSVDPRVVPYVNRRRIAGMRTTPVRTPGERITMRGMIAQEQLRAGLLAEADSSLAELRRMAGVYADLVGPEFDVTVRELEAIGAFRRGVVANCLPPGTSARCRVPTLPDDVPPPEADAFEEALSRYLELARLEPDNLNHRWLLNVTAMLLGRWPDAVPEALRLPAESPMFRSPTDVGVFVDVAHEAGVDVLGLAGGSVLDDLDGDGDLDLMASSRGLLDPLRLLLNRGDGTFEDATERAGLQGLVGGLNLVQADYDNDGDVDVLVLRGAWMPRGFPNSLLRNEGGGFFTDATRQAGIFSEHPTQTAVWADFDGDGWLDLVIGNESTPGAGRHPVEVYRNLGDGTFQDVAGAVGIAADGFVKAVVAGDYDGDGRPDLYVSRLREPNVLLRNVPGTEGAPWRFVDVTDEAGVAGPNDSFPAWFFDFDQDGREDLFVSGYFALPADLAAEALGRAHEAVVPALYRNRGDGTFEDVAARAGLDRVLYTMGSNFGDLDNDGWLDVYAGTGDPDPRTIMPSRMFRNVHGTFEEVTASGGFGFLHKGHGVSFGDVDDDGDQDLYVVLGGAYEGDVARNVLLVNPGHGGHWLRLHLEGRRANRAGVGARIRVDVEEGGRVRSIHRVLGSGGSFGASPLRVEVGLGRAERVVRVEVRWPGSGTLDVIEGVAVDAAYRIVEGSGRATPLPLHPVDLGRSVDPGER